MGILQKLERLSTSGDVTITGDKGWFIVTFRDSEVEIKSEMPTLKQAIESVDKNLSLLVAKETSDNWHSLIDPYTME